MQIFVVVIHYNNSFFILFLSNVKRRVYCIYGERSLNNRLMAEGCMEIIVYDVIKRVGVSGKYNIWHMHFTE